MDNENNENVNDEQEENISDYLYTIININNRANRNKQNKVEYSKNNLIRNVKKPININGDEKIFSSYIHNDIDIIKLNNRIKKY